MLELGGQGRRDWKHHVRRLICDSFPERIDELEAFRDREFPQGGEVVDEGCHFLNLNAP